MSKQKELFSSTAELQTSVDSIRTNVASLTDIKLSMASSFLRGVAYTLGVVMTVAILIPLTLWFLRGIEWPPLIGGVISSIIDSIDQAR